MCTVGLPGAQESPLSFLLISLTSPVKVSPSRFTAGLAPGASPRLRKAAASLPRTNTRGRLSPASGELTRKETAQLLLKLHVGGRAQWPRFRASSRTSRVPSGKAWFRPEEEAEPRSSEEMQRWVEQ